MTRYLNQSKLYVYHVANLRSIAIALNNTAISARHSLALENKPASESFTRLYAFLVGAWAETRLNKLINENGAFTDLQKARIFSEPTQLDQWISSVEISFREYYKVPNAELSIYTLPHTAFYRFKTVLDIINKDLRSVIEVRNKLAHGQWVYPLNTAGNDVEEEKYKGINKENLLSLQFKHSMITTLADIIHDLAVSLPTFERDFDYHFKAIINIRNNLQNRSFNLYEQVLIKKNKNGIANRKLNK